MHSGLFTPLQVEAPSPLRSVNGILQSSPGPLYYTRAIVYHFLFLWFVPHFPRFCLPQCPDWVKTLGPFPAKAP